MKLKDMMPWNGHELKVRGGQDIFSEMERRMNRMFDEFFNLELPSRLKEKEFGMIPRMDVSVGEKEIVVTAELPGVEENDVDISLEKGQLIISGEKKQEHEEQSGDFYRVERSYGRFRRVVPIDHEIDSEGVKAGYKNGVLKITLPRTQRDRENVRKINISKE